MPYTTLMRRKRTRALRVSAVYRMSLLYCDATGDDTGASQLSVFISKERNNTICCFTNEGYLHICMYCIHILGLWICLLLKRAILSDACINELCVC